MKVSEAMSRDVCLTDPDKSIREAARLMAERDIGAVPVGENDRLVGMITDRDIAVRAVAQGRDLDTRIRDVMSENLMYCFEDEQLEDVARNMGDVRVRRLPVLSRQKRLVGIVALSDLARQRAHECCGEALAGIGQQGGTHSQSVQ